MREPFGSFGSIVLSRRVHRNQLEGLLETIRYPLLTQEGWGGTWDAAFLTTPQVMLKLLVKSHTLGTTALGLLQMWKLISREGEPLSLEKTRSCDSCLFHFTLLPPSGHLEYLRTRLWHHYMVHANSGVKTQTVLLLLLFFFFCIEVTLQQINWSPSLLKAVGKHTWL